MDLVRLDTNHTNHLVVTTIIRMIFLHGRKLVMETYLIDTIQLDLAVKTDRIDGNPYLLDLIHTTIKSIMDLHPIQVNSGLHINRARDTLLTDPTVIWTEILLQCQNLLPTNPRNSFHT